MTMEQIRELVDATPFQPFTIHLADGQSVRVPHPDFIAIGPRGRTVIVYRSDERFRIIDVMLVTELRVGRKRVVR
ncbi:MAG: hypothetical protein KGS61_12735 [Verrucomicrobia bacterium]|nr:hypothetical protein [Verrucomicrobiota bacterium]